MEPAISPGLENPVWGSDWRRVRGQWALDPAVAHLNHGSFGAVPIPVQTAQDRLRAEAETNPNAFFSRILPDKLEEARRTTAAFLRADPDGFVFVPNATTGVNTVLASVGLGPEEEVLITDHAYGAVRMAAERACSRFGAELVVQRVPLPADGSDDLGEAVLRGVTEKTRLAIVDHIASPTGMAFPIGELVTALRSRGVLSLVDAAHAPGMVDVDLTTLDPDFWTGNFHKMVLRPARSGRAVRAAGASRTDHAARHVMVRRRGVHQVVRMARHAGRHRLPVRAERARVHGWSRVGTTAPAQSGPGAPRPRRRHGGHRSRGDGRRSE